MAKFSFHIVLLLYIVLFIVLYLLCIGNSVANKSYKTVNCTIPDIIENIELGDCGRFNIENEPLQGSVTYAGLDKITDQVTTDGWKGDWIIIKLDRGTNLQCLIDGWIDRDNPEISTTRRDFICNGKVYKNLLYLNGFRNDRR